MEKDKKKKPVCTIKLTIDNCPFFNCAINNGVGGCVSTNKIQCKSIPNNFDEDKF